MKIASKQINEVDDAISQPIMGRAVILYDHLETLLAANQLLDRLASNGQSACDWLTNSWRFDMLHRGFGLEAYRALEESVDAELVVVAIHEPSAWSELPECWLCLWADYCRSEAPRLMMLAFDRATESLEFSPITVLLRRLAEAREVSFSVLCASAAGEGDPVELGRFAIATRPVRATVGSPQVVCRCRASAT